MKRIAVALVVVAACVAGLGLAGCGRAEVESVRRPALAKAGAAQSEEAPAPAEKQRAADADVAEKDRPAASTAGLPSVPQARMVIKTASLSVRVKDVAAAYAKAVQVAEARGGFVQSSAQYREGGESAEVTIRIPPAGFLPLIAALEGLGTTEEKSISGQDVTEEYYDLSADLENQVEVRDRLFQLLRQAKKVEDAIAVEQQLERIGGNINRIKGRMKYLETMVGMSTITLGLYTEERPAAEPFINWRMIGHGFFRAAQVLVRALFVVLQVLIVAIPLLVIAAAVAWGVVLLVRMARARGWLRKQRPPARR
jgi:hypothetical protein